MYRFWGRFLWKEGRKERRGVWIVSYHLSEWKGKKRKEKGKRKRKRKE